MQSIAVSLKHVETFQAKSKNKWLHCGYRNCKDTGRKGWSHLGLGSVSWRRPKGVSQYKSVQVSKISKIIKPLHAFHAQPMTLQCNTETRGISHVCETGVARKCMAFRANLRIRVDCFKQWNCKNKPEGSEGSEGLVSGVHWFKWQYLCRGELDPFNSLQSQSCVSPCLYLYDSISCVYNILNM